MSRELSEALDRQIASTIGAAKGHDAILEAASDVRSNFKGRSEGAAERLAQAINDTVDRQKTLIDVLNIEDISTKLADIDVSNYPIQFNGVTGNYVALVVIRHVGRILHRVAQGMIDAIPPDVECWILAMDDEPERLIDGDSNGRPGENDVLVSPSDIQHKTAVNISNSILMPPDPIEFLCVNGSYRELRDLLHKEASRSRRRFCIGPRYWQVSIEGRNGARTSQVIINGAAHALPLEGAIWLQAMLDNLGEFVSTKKLPDGMSIARPSDFRKEHFGMIDDRYFESKAGQGWRILESAAESVHAG